eukprot:Rhum_TRINITY_DN14470_c28_g1::Rhum_TRINITY_DN14470_c28_g1_i1::g.91657::m.91657
MQEEVLAEGVVRAPLLPDGRGDQPGALCVEALLRVVAAGLTDAVPEDVGVVRLGGEVRQRPDLANLTLHRIGIPMPARLGLRHLLAQLLLRRQHQRRQRRFAAQHVLQRLHVAEGSGQPHHVRDVAEEVPPAVARQEKRRRALQRVEVQREEAAADVRARALGHLEAEHLGGVRLLGQGVAAFDHVPASLDVLLALLHALQLLVQFHRGVHVHRRPQPLQVVRVLLRRALLHRDVQVAVRGLVVRAEGVEARRQLLRLQRHVRRQLRQARRRSCHKRRAALGALGGHQRVRPRLSLAERRLRLRLRLRRGGGGSSSGSRLVRGRRLGRLRLRNRLHHHLRRHIRHLDGSSCGVGGGGSRRLRRLLLRSRR